MHQIVSEPLPKVPFLETPFVRKKRRNERLAQGIFAVMVACILIPLSSSSAIS